MQVFNFLFYISMVLSIMYLFSSGKEYMKSAAKSAGRTHEEDKVAMAIMAAISFYGAFNPHLSSTFTYVAVAPLLMHLNRIAYLSYKHKTQK